MNKKQMIKTLETHYAQGVTKDFAEFLGVHPQRITTWKGRNTFDPELLYAKCEGINPHWLLTGEGSMLKGETETPSATEAISALKKVVSLLEAENEKQRAEIERLQSLFPQPAPQLQLTKKGKAKAALPSK